MLVPFLLGAITMASAAIGFVFMRFARRTHDRFFLYFAAFFWLDGASRVAQAFGSLSDNDAATYLARLLAFVVILVGILDKNLARRGPDRR